MKNKVNKVDVDKSVLVTVDLSKLSDVVKIMSLKKMRKMLRWKTLKIKYKILLA